MAYSVAIKVAANMHGNQMSQNSSIASFISNRFLWLTLSPVAVCLVGEMALDYSPGHVLRW